jgi:hypothetical protein
MKKLCLAVVSLALLACSRPDAGVRVTAEKPVAPAPVAKARVEPVFYNGKTYQFRMTPRSGGLNDLSVAGMTSTQQKDAIAVATSSLRYFGCPDRKTGKLVGEPRYADAVWSMSARCG